MKIARLLVRLAMGTVLLSAAGAAAAAESFKVRLSPLPVNAAGAADMAGTGSLVATLDGSTLKLEGTFSGMTSPATAAHLHHAPKGLRGPVAFTLTVTAGTTGTVSGVLTLSAAQAADLRKGWYYVQVHTEKNPDGQLRGWILK